MKRYVIERDLPGVGASRAAQRRSGDLQWRAGEAVCDLGLEGIVSKPHISLSLRPVENVDKSQKSEGTGGHSRCGWDVLI